MNLHEIDHIVDEWEWENIDTCPHPYLPPHTIDVFACLEDGGEGLVGSIVVKGEQ